MPKFSDLMKEERRPKSGAGETSQAKPVPESVEKVILFLPQHQLRWIDQIARECKARGGKQLWRGEVIRGILEGIIGREIDLLAVNSEEEFANRIRELFTPR